MSTFCILLHRMIAGAVYWERRDTLGSRTYYSMLSVNLNYSIKASSITVLNNNMLPAFQNKNKSPQ